MRNLLTLLLLIFLATSTFGAYRNVVIPRTLLNNVTATATGSSIQSYNPKRTYQFTGATATGAGTAQALIQVSNDDSNWITIDTLNLTLTASNVAYASDYYTTDTAWVYTRGILNAITGTGATVSLVSGEQSRF